MAWIDPKSTVHPIPTTRFMAVLLLLLGMALGAGCQSSNTSMVAALPPPNFNGPIIAPQAKAPPVAPRASVPVRRPVAAIGPQEWQPAAAPRAWKWIVIHHSATPAGSAAVFDRMHRQKGWDELGYHFVIGNGTDSANGQVEVGSRWRKQKHGAHAKTADNRYNDFGVGICLVGDFDGGRPTAQQTQALTRLVAYLMRTYRIPASNVIGHGDTKATACPGRYMNVAQVRRSAAAQAIAEDSTRAPDSQTAAAKLSSEHAH